MSDGIDSIKGDEECLLYRIHYVGGSQDGLVGIAYRPYFEMKVDGEVYRANEEPPDHEIWVDDFTREIYLHYRGEE